jgi:hypothetical protein
VAQRSVSDEETGGKIALFISSIVIGAICSSVLHLHFRFPLTSSIPWGILTAILNPAAARLAVCLSQKLHHLAFPDTYEMWSVERKVWMGAFWPITLLFWIVVFIFFISINRIFR